MEYLGCYHDTYLKTDVLVLTDVLEAFRNSCLKNYKLDPAHFFNALGLTWQALLKTTAEYCGHENKDCELCPDDFRFELLTDLDMLDGITQAVKRYVKANNKYMKGLCNPD